MANIYTQPGTPIVLDQLNNITSARQKLGGIGRSKIYELIMSGELKSVKVGRRRMVPDSAIAEYVSNAAAL